MTKPRTVEKLIRFVGVALIILGIIGGFATYDTKLADDYTNAKEVYEELYDNEYAFQQYALSKELQSANLSLSLSVGFGGAIGGIFFLGLSTIIQLLMQLNEKQTRATASEKE